MRFSEQEHDDTQIELTPLIDVVFLLLIFFNGLNHVYAGIVTADRPARSQRE